jgi:hypothetical protein
MLLLAIASGVAIGLLAFGLAGRGAPSAPTSVPAPSVVIAPEAPTPSAPATPSMPAQPDMALEPSIAEAPTPPVRYDDPGIGAPEPAPPGPPIPPQQIGTPPPAAAPQ